MSEGMENCGMSGKSQGDKWQPSADIKINCVSLNT